MKLFFYFLIEFYLLVVHKLLYFLIFSCESVLPNCLQLLGSYKEGSDTRLNLIFGFSSYLCILLIEK